MPQPMRRLTRMLQQLMAWTFSLASTLEMVGFATLHNFVSVKASRHFAVPAIVTAQLTKTPAEESGAPCLQCWRPRWLGSSWRSVATGGDR